MSGMTAGDSVTLFRHATPGSPGGPTVLGLGKQHGYMLVAPFPCQAMLAEILAEQATVERDALAKHDRAELVHRGWSVGPCQPPWRRVRVPGGCQRRGACGLAASGAWLLRRATRLPARRPRGHVHLLLGPRRYRSPRLRRAAGSVGSRVVGPGTRRSPHGIARPH